MAAEHPRFTIESFDADSPTFDDVLRVYLAVFGGHEGAAYDFHRRYAAYPGFVGLLAREGRGRVVGIAWGTRSLPGQWWHDAVAARVGADHPALHDAWCLTQLGVLPDEQGQGIGTRLLTAILAKQPCPRALLSTQVANATARALYERHGWRYIHPGFVFPGGTEAYVVMAREVDRATADD